MFEEIPPNSVKSLAWQWCSGNRTRGLHRISCLSFFFFPFLFKAHRRARPQNGLLRKTETHVTYKGLGRPRHRNFQKCLRGNSSMPIHIFQLSWPAARPTRKSCISAQLAGFPQEFPCCMATLDNLICAPEKLLLLTLLLNTRCA